MKLHLYFLLSLTLLLTACQQEKTDQPFVQLSPKRTGIEFRNLLKEDENFNIFKYQYFHNGGGLAVGDFNNDGLQDLVFTGNMVKNRLYINQGDFRFKDYTQQSGIAAKEGWCTGVTTVDINEDGWLDLYICRAGYPFDDLRSNLLFINNGDLSFTESAATYGLDDYAFSTHSAFFDYDKDGDLDLFLLNHSTVEYSRGALEVMQLRSKKSPAFTNKLFRNDHQRFVNVTEEAGIYSNVLSFSLGLSITDINGDHWPDIFVGNDFNEPDYLFLNQQDGTFADAFSESFDHTSMFSMGSDIADFNNDGLLDLVSLDMLPEGNFEQKMHSGADNYDKVSMLEKNGFFKQYSRNMLQLNNGDGTFSEIGQLAGISNTDWSWAPLFFDFDNDGAKDLFIANGYLRDHTDMDFLNFTANEVVKINRGEEAIDFDGYIAQMPPIILPNYFFYNQGNLQFEDKTKAWQMDHPSVTQSAVYVDLDNDGDLDLVLNNTDEYASVCRNNSEVFNDHAYLSVVLKGRKENAFGIGTKVSIYAGDQLFFQEQQPVRGFQSTVDPVLNFGLGTLRQIDSIKVVWPTDEQQLLTNVEVNQRLELSIEDARKKITSLAPLSNPYLLEQSFTAAPHLENEFVDFNTQFLLPWLLSREGPAMAVGDVNKDGGADLYLGNAQGSIGQLLLQQTDGSFEATSSIFDNDDRFEDQAACFFDANGDGWLDLYIASGGYETPINDPALQDRFYLNNGRGQLLPATDRLPAFLSHSSCVAVADCDGDGDQDLFVGGGYEHARYPEASPSRLLINDGKGYFSIQPLSHHRSVKSAAWVDLNGDTSPELIVAGEWTPIQVYQKEAGQWQAQSQRYFEDTLSGLWNALHFADLDGDGDTDLIAGNLGTNSQLSANPDQPLELYYDDFDGNNSIDPLLCYYVQGKSWPFISRDDLIGQLPGLKKKFLFFKDYAQSQIQNILSPEQLSKAKHLKAETLETCYFENVEGRFTKRSLPVEAQIAPVHAIHTMDVDQDGQMDLLLGGNTLATRVRLGRLDGNHLQLFSGNGKGGFQWVPYARSGAKIKGSIRQIESIRLNNQAHLLVGINNEAFKLYQIQP